MAENMNETAGTVNPTINRDTAMDIASLIKTAKKEEPATDPVPTVNGPMTAPEGKTEEAVSHKTKLEQMMEAQKNQTLGMVVNTADLNHDEKIQMKNKMADDAMSDADKYLADMDAQIEVAKQIKVPRPANPQQMVGIMDALDRAAKNPEILKTGEVPAEETPATESTEQAPAEENKTEETAPATEEVAEKTEEEKKAELKKQVINVLIDKTGMGADFHFTDEEKEKLTVSNEIHVTEVEDVDLATITVKKPEKSFVDSVNEYQLSSTRVPVVFTVSRFRAYMTGLTYGEMSDIVLTNEANNFDKLNKRLSIIYNKMVNPSCGKFDSYDDFLKKFAFADMSLAIYGLVIATFPEVDEIGMNCNNETCKKSFTHKFSPRSLLRFEECGDKFISAMDEIVNCPAGKEKELLETSPCQKHKRVRLPDSKYIIEIGFASAYEYLYNVMDKLDGDKFKENHPDDVNGVMADIVSLLPIVRSVYVPNADSSYTCYTDANDMIEALYTVKPGEIKLIVQLMRQYVAGYEFGFFLTNVRCPHCGSLSKMVPLDSIENMLFRQYQRLTNTNLDTSSITE